MYVVSYRTCVHVFSGEPIAASVVHLRNVVLSYMPIPCSLLHCCLSHLHTHTLTCADVGIANVIRLIAT